MEQIYSSLTQRALHVYESAQTHATEHISHSPVSKRVVIAFAGPPGSGKTTIAAEVVKRLNRLNGQKKSPSEDINSPDLESQPFATVLPMDGFHYPRSYLDSLPNADEAHACRGASWTFDAPGVLKLVRTLDSSKTTGPGSAEVILAPSFSHVEKDPIPDAISIHPGTGIVILEGNYLLLGTEEPWSEIKGLVDDSWFVDVDPEVAVKRVAKRHLKAGIEGSWEEAEKRARGNDGVNGEVVRKGVGEDVGVRVVSVEVEDGELMREMEIWAQVEGGGVREVGMEVRIVG